MQSCDQIHFEASPEQDAFGVGERTCAYETMTQPFATPPLSADDFPSRLTDAAIGFVQTGTVMLGTGSPTIGFEARADEVDETSDVQLSTTELLPSGEHSALPLKTNLLDFYSPGQQALAVLEVRRADRPFTPNDIPLSTIELLPSDERSVFRLESNVLDFFFRGQQALALLELRRAHRLLAPVTFGAVTPSRAA